MRQTFFQQNIDDEVKRRSRLSKAKSAASGARQRVLSFGRRGRKSGGGGAPAEASVEHLVEAPLSPGGADVADVT